MGLLAFITNCLYQLLVRTHILYYLSPYLVDMLDDANAKNSNYTIMDAKGHGLPAVKMNGKLFPAFGVERVKTYRGITIRDSDVLLTGYPKTGCHWTHEILHMLITGKAELTKSGKMVNGMLDFLPDILLDSMPSPRVLNTHLLFEDIPDQVKTKNTKIIYTSRNPKDTVVSYYNHVLNLPCYNYKGEFDDMFTLFMSGEIEYGSYFDYTLSWDKQLKKPTTNEILLVKFEDLKAQPLECIRKMAKFLNIEITEQFAQDVFDAANFKSMKQKRSNDVYKGIFRKGVVGDWKNWLSDEQSATIDKVWQERMLGCVYQPEY